MSNPPMSQPPGKGMPPCTFQCRGRKMAKGIHTKKARKYVFSVVQIPMSICAQVPEKMRKMPQARSTTVSLSEARGLKALRKVAFTAIPSSRGSRREAEAAGEGEETLALFAEERARAGHLDEVGEPPARRQHHEHALGRLAGTLQIQQLRRRSVHFQCFHRLLRHVRHRCQADLAAPAVDVGQQPTDVAREAGDRDLGLV